MVTERCVDPGDLVTQSTSGQPLFTVADVDTVRVRATVPEADVPWVREGAVATLNVAAIAGRGFTGKVSRIAGSVDESTRTMLVEVDLPNSTGELRPGMYGELTLVLEHKDNALVLPARVVRHDEQGHAFVYTVTSDNVVHKTAVVTGMDTGAEIEILSPLEGGERIVDATITTLNDGQRVSVQE
jgi:RND family efflux transporter MFP subunit